MAILEDMVIGLQIALEEKIGHSLSPSRVLLREIVGEDRIGPARRA